MQLFEQRPKPKLWIAKLQLFLEKLVKFPILASAIPFAIPLTIWGMRITQITGYKLFSLSVVLSLVWLAIAPYLLGIAYITVAAFFEDNRNLFKTDDHSVRELQAHVLNDLGSPRYLFISIPLMIVCVLVLLNSVYHNSPTQIRIWVTITYGILFFIAGAGFWGISRFIYIIDQICMQELNFNPYHSDHFGGLACLSYLNIKGPLYFFSGFMIYPIIFDVLRSFNNNELVEIGLWSVVILALGFGLVGFFIPQFQIHNLIIACKQKALEKSETVLQSFLKNLSSEECNDKETAEVIQLKIDVYYVYFHKRIINVREWPFDATVFFQLGSSLIIPILVTGIEIYTK